MNCDDIDRALFENPAASRWPPEIEAHLNSCKLCKELVEKITTSAAPEPVSSETLSQIQQRLSADLRPVRPMASAAVLFAAFAGIFLSVLALRVYRLGGAFGTHVLSPLQAATMLGIIVIGTSFLTYSLIQQMVPGSRHWIPQNLLPLGLLAALLLAIVALFPFQHEQNFWARNWFCINVGCQTGLLAAVPIWLVLRRGAFISRRASGAAAGLLAGFVGVAVLEIHCPNLDAWHILISHLGPAVICCLVGLGIGSVSEIASARSLR